MITRVVSCLAILYIPFPFYLCQDISDFRCTEEFCLDYEYTKKCSVPDLEKCYNETYAALLPSPTVCSCCETCLLYQSKGESCIVGSPGQKLPDTICGPGLKCVNQKCVEMTIDTDDDQNYSCSTDDQCQCLVKVDNKSVPIFGTFPKEERDGRQCGCSIQEYKVRSMDLRALPFNGAHQPFVRCLPSGLFDPLQCYDGICSCVDTKTGVYDETVPRVSVLALGPGSPQCFNTTKYNHNREYYRECEKALNTLLKARDLAEAEGFQFLFPFKFDCRPDGEFEKPLSEDVRKALLLMESSSSLRSIQLHY